MVLKHGIRHPWPDLTVLCVRLKPNGPRDQTGCEGQAFSWPSFGSFPNNTTLQSERAAAPQTEEKIGSAV